MTSCGKPWSGVEHPWCTTWAILYEFLRVSTHSRVFPRPLKSRQALDFIANLVSRDEVVLLTETARHAAMLEIVVSGLSNPGGNLFHDIHTATRMREHGVPEIITADTDFLQFGVPESNEPATRMNPAVLDGAVLRSADGVVQWRRSNMTKMLSACACIITLAGVTLLPRSRRAQALYGSVVGHVRDSSDAVVPGATVTILNAETNQSRQTTTNEMGDYTFATILSGNYELKVVKEAFGSFARSGIAMTI